ISPLPLPDALPISYSPLQPERLRGRVIKSNVGEDFMSGQSRLLCGVGIFALALLGGDAIAHTPEQPPHQTYSEGDLKLESGEVIKDFSISYVTHGTLNEKKKEQCNSYDFLNCRKSSSN